MPTEDTFAVRFLKGFRRFRDTRWFRVTYLVLLGLIVSQMYFLTTSALACVVVLLMPLIVFVFPYWVGERKVRHFAVNALPVFAIAIVVATALSTQTLVSQDRAIPLRSFPGFDSYPTMALSNGTVIPYRADPSQPFVFRVNLTTTRNGTPSDYNVLLNLTVISGISVVDLPTIPMTYSPGTGSAPNPHNGTYYVVRQNLTGAIYGYGFAVTDKNGNWTITNVDFGPITASWGSFYALILYFTGTSMLLPLTFYYLIIFLWWYTVRARDLRTRELGRTLDIPKEKRPAAKGGTAPATPAAEPGERAGKVAAFTCTNCGADVTEADTKCPKCGAVFEE